MRKLAMLLMMLPFLVLADVAPMSRDEWERCRQFVLPISVDVPSASLAGYVLAVLMGVCLSVCVFALTKRCLHRGETWRNFVSKRMEWVILTVIILAGCLCVEVEHLTGACAKCPFGSRCKAGCSAMAISQTGTLTETPFCIRQLETERIIKEMTR